MNVQKLEDSQAGSVQNQVRQSMQANKAVQYVQGIHGLSTQVKAG